MTSLGVWSCRWRELQPITFGGTAPADGGNAVDVESGGSAQGPADEDMGFVRGGRRGRGRDGAGEYEMVGLKSAT